MSQVPPPNIPLNYAPPSSGPNMRTVAKYQRALNLCLLVYIAAIFLQFLLPAELRFIAGFVMLPAIITCAVFVFLLALSIYSTAAGIILGILTLIPLLGLIPLLIINSKATKMLRAAGYKVGLLGANPNQS